jgi:endonuclease G
MLVGPAKRTNNFMVDASLPGSADLSDYDKSGYDRGHQAPAGDAKYAQNVMDQSFFLTNMAPQVGIGFNRGAWKYLEETVRAWILCGGHKNLFVITGPVYAGSKYAPIGHDKVVVPARFYKIVYDPDSGHALGFMLPNEKIGSTIDLQKYLVPIADIETETGLDFFAAFDRRRQKMLETQTGTAWGHASTCSGG